MAIAGFNANYYVQTYPDVLVAISQGIYKSAEEHFVKNGAKEGRNPNANFDSKYYLANNQDVLQAVASGAIASAYDHYIAYGYKEGRIPSAALASFNGQAYLDANADVKTAGYTAATALGHYVLFGAAENRTGGGNTQQQVTGNYVGTTADDTVTPAGGQASTVRVEGGQQGTKGDTLVVTSGSAASFQTMNLANDADQNQTRDNTTGNNTGNKIGPVVQGFENIDATAATINMNLTALDRTSITNTGSATSAQTGSVILGGTGRDTLTGAAGADSLVGNDGNDQITGGAGNDTLLGGVGDDNIAGGAGDDRIEDGAGNDTVTGDAGADTINVGAGTNSIDGGADNDTITLTADQATSITVSTISGNTGNDTIVLNGTAITAASRVSVSGGAGNDTITAGLGVETINAGAGNDTVKFTAANLGATDVFNGNDGQDFLQLEIPTGSGTNTYVLTPVNGQFAGFEGIELIDSSANTNAKQYKIVLTDNFVANNLVSGSFLIDARGLPGGSNLVIDFSQLTSASAARFATNAFRVLASPSTDVRDQNNVTITNTYLTNASNSALSAIAAFSVYAGDTTVVAGARNADGTINTNGQAAYTTTGGTAEVTSGTVSYNFTQTTGTAATLTTTLNNGFGSGFLSASGDTINSGTFLANGNLIADATTTDGDRLDATLTAAVAPTIVNIETLNLTSFGGGLNFSNVTGATSINVTGTSFTATGVASGSTMNLTNIFGAQSFTLATAGASNALTLNLSGIQSGSAFSFADSAAGAIETVNLNLLNSTTTTLTTLTAASTVNITGSGNLTLTSNDATASTFNASTLSGVVSYTQAAAANVAFTGTTGADTFVFGTTGTLTVADTIDGGAGTDTITTSGYTTTTDLNAITNVEVLNLTGASLSYNYTTVDTLVAFGQTLTVNAGSASGTSTLQFVGTAETNGAFNITGTANNDTLTGGANSDTISGGAGSDTITGGLGQDVLTGGAGADTFSFVGTAGTTNQPTIGLFDTITDFVVGTDKLQFTTVADAVSAQQAAVQAAVTALAAGSTAAQIANAMANANTTNLGVSFATFGGDTYVLYETTGANTTFTVADDIFIKLTGITTIPTFAADVVA